MLRFICTYCFIHRQTSDSQGHATTSH